MRPPNLSAYAPVGAVSCNGRPSSSAASLAATNSLIQEASWSGLVRGTQCLPSRVRRTNCGAHSSSWSYSFSERKMSPVGVISWTGTWA